MAQYGHNFYGSSYYGETNAFSGWYTTREIPTDEPLKTSFDVNINALLPHATYGPTASEITQVSGTWNYDSALGKISSNTPSAELSFRITCDKFIIKYEQRSTGVTNVNVHITTKVPGAADIVTTQTFSTNSTTINANAKFEVSGLQYGMQTVRIYLDSTNTSDKFFNFKGVEARVANFTVETRAKTGSTWSAYAKVSLSDTLVSDATDQYLLTGTSPNYVGATQIQVKIWLATSDNEITPELLDLETVSGDSTARTEDGKWEAVVNMVEVAKVAGVGVEFRNLTYIDWVAPTLPSGTRLTIRSSSAPASDATKFGPRSVPYKQGVNRVRLKEGRTLGWIDSPLNDPYSEHDFVSLKEWTEWRDQSFLPPNTNKAHIEYWFLDQTKNENTNYHNDLTPTRYHRGLFAPTKVKNNYFFLRAKLKRDDVYTASPVVDYITFKSHMEYNKPYTVNDYGFSAVNNYNTGKDIILNMSNIKNTNQDDTFWDDVPVEITSDPRNKVVYKLEDNTNRPQDVMLYLDSQKDTGLKRTNTTLSLTDKIWAETKPRVPKNYQYSGGSVKYPNVQEMEMDIAFTPSLTPSIPYRYFLLKGWPNQYHLVQAGDTMATIAQDYEVLVADLLAVNPSIKLNNDGSLMPNQSILLPNNSNNPDVELTWKNGANMVTQMSAHNANLEGGNVLTDSIVASVSRESTKGETKWVSEQKIYQGIINLNDIKSRYNREHSAGNGSELETTYTVKDGETYASIASDNAMYEVDLRLRNEALDGEVVAGQSIILPAKFSLPRIDPMAIVSANPYKIEIVYNSVKKEDGTILPEERVFQDGEISITPKTENLYGITMQRGPIANGKDALKHPNVINIDRVYNADGFEWVKGVQHADGTWANSYRLDGNYIDWGLTGAGSYEPAEGEIYYIDYTVEVPDKVSFIMDTDYIEEGGVDHIWRSPEVKEFKGTCQPGKDMRIELPPTTDWQGVSNANEEIEDIEYLIEDNDSWVKTWIEYNANTNKYYAVGSLQDRVPKDNWFPTIQTGYYYLGQEEFYLYNEPVTVESTERDMPVAKNVRYVDGKYSNAVKLQEGSTNLIKNSGFDVLNTNKTVYKMTF